MSNVKSILFSELLHLNEAETKRWQAWFKVQPAAVLEVPVTIANAGTVRGLLFHIFAVELRHSERLIGAEATPHDSLPKDSVDSLFHIGERARATLKKFLDSTSDDDLRQMLEIHTVSAGLIHSSKRKLLTHIFIHGIRHWAQLATALREAGFATNWRHDVVFMQEFE